MNTHESYVSPKTARLLKQAGFDWECNHYYLVQNNDFELKSDYRYPAQNYNDLMATMDSLSFQFETFSAPTLAVAQRWLREVKKRNVIVSYIPSWQYAQRYHVYIAELNMNVGESECDNYEAALEAGIQKCLTLILEKR